MNRSMENQARFPTTRWTIVGRAGDRLSQDGAQAMSELLTQYLPALRAHLRWCKRIDADEAEDILQSFLAAKFLEQNLAAIADPARGKFRTLVLTALDRFLVSERRRDGAVKRGGLRAGERFDETPEIVGSLDEPAQAFDIAWAENVLGVAIDHMRGETSATGQAGVWGVFDARVVGPLMRGEPPASYESLIERFGFVSPAAAANALVTAKRMFKRVLRQVVAEYAGPDAGVEEEIRELRSILSGSGAG